MSQEPHSLISRAETRKSIPPFRDRPILAVSVLIVALCLSSLSGAPAAAQTPQLHERPARPAAQAPVQLSEKCPSNFGYLIPYYAEFTDELQYLNAVDVCWDGLDPSTSAGAHYLVYNGSDVVIQLPEAAPADGVDGVDIIWPSDRLAWTSDDYDLTRLALNLDATEDPIVLPGEYAQVFWPYRWYVDYAASVTWLAQEKILPRVEDAKPKAFKRIFVAKSRQRKAIVECLEAAWDLGYTAAQTEEYLTAEELFSKSAGLAVSGSQCADAWRKLNHSKKVKAKFPSIKKAVVVFATVEKYSAPADDFLRILVRAIAAVK